MPRGNVIRLHDRPSPSEDRILRETLEIARRLHMLCRDIEGSNLPLDCKAKALSELVVVGNGLKRAFDAVVGRA